MNKKGYYKFHPFSMMLVVESVISRAPKLFCVILIYTSNQPITMTQHLIKIFVFSSFFFLFSARYLDNDQLVLTTQLDVDDQQFSSEMDDIEETEEEVTNDWQTESQINLDLMCQPNFDDFQMIQPEGDNNQPTTPEMYNTEETRLEGDQPMINLDWVRNIEPERVRPLSISYLQFI